MSPVKVCMSSWTGEVMIGLVLLLQCGSSGELKPIRVRIRDRCFISEGEVDVNRAAQPQLMTRWWWMKRGVERALQRWHKDVVSHIAQDYTHSEQQWVLADPLNRRYKVTLQWNLCVFSASQQHAVLEERK